MVDDSVEEHIDNPTNTESENFTVEIIPTKDTQTINPNQESNNMEVHHHPDLHHKKKHLKEYFLEFIMIFLAVSMGFVAENLREERIEHNKAKEFAISLIKDLENDNNFIKNSKKLRVWREKKLDSLSNMLSKPLIPLEYNNVYYFSQFLFNRLAFPSNDATFQGMKSSGSMRYFKSLKLQSQIYGYYVINSYLKDDNNVIEENETEAYKITSQILKQEYFSEIIDMGNDSIAYGTETKRLNHPTPLLSDDQLLINQLSSLAFLERKRSQNFVLLASYLQQRGIDLIMSLKLEYNIKDGVKEE
jgi:hypothetical protein